MSDDATTAARKKLLEIDKTIKRLDPAIRSAAFDILAPIYFGGTKRPIVRVPAGEHESDIELGNGDRGEFYGNHDHDKPADNLLLVVAWLYSQFGKFPITRADVELEASLAGLIVPARSDVTMRQAKEKGKNLFRKMNKGWELTVHGEARIRELYKVKKGSNPRPDSKESK